MLINPLSGILSGASASATQKAEGRAKPDVAQLISSLSAPKDTTGLSLAAQLQNQLGGIRKTSANIAEAISLTQVADQGAENIGNVLGQLAALAKQATSGGLTDETRSALNTQFQDLLQQLDTAAGSVRFGQQNLFDGSLSGKGALSLQTILGDTGSQSELTSLSIGEVSRRTLLGDAPISIATRENAADAAARLSDASAGIKDLQQDIGAFQNDLQLAGVSLASALFNQDAARTTLDDISQALSDNLTVQRMVQLNGDMAIDAQIKRLPPSMVEMLIG